MNSDSEDFSTGRSDIHNQVWELINESPIFGTGICGDEANMHEMAHSLYLSILCTYGIIIGFMFITFILIKTCRALKHSSGLNHQILVLFICMVFPRGFTGGDIWQSDVFWQLMGIIFMINTNYKRMLQ